MVLVVENLPANAGELRDVGLIPGSGRSPGQEDPLTQGMASHSSILAWKIPCSEEPDRLQSIGSHRVGHNQSNLACMHTNTLLTSLDRSFRQKISKKTLTLNGALDMNVINI